MEKIIALVGRVMILPAGDGGTLSAMAGDPAQGPAKAPGLHSRDIGNGGPIRSDDCALPQWERFEIILYFCVVVASAGLGTFLSYHLDHLVSTRNRADESEEREKALLTEVKQ